MITAPTTAPLTAEDIADIAQFLGAKCNYDRLGLSGNWYIWDDKVTGNLLDIIGEDPEIYRNFQLHLRDLRHLTPDDVRAMAGLCGFKAWHIVKAEFEVVYTWVTDEVTYTVHLWFDGEISCIENEATSRGAVLINPAAAIRYAMRAGFFWPGSVRRELAKLIE